MKPMTAQAIATTIGGTLTQGNPEQLFTDVFTDTRNPRTGGLFVALVGARFDAGKFAHQALTAGAGGVIVAGDAATTIGAGLDAAVIRVDDTLVALQALAAHVRAIHPGRVVAITGSVGKTTGKDMIAAALGAFGTVHRTPGNYNNHIGLPLTLLATTGDEDFLVLELGMSAAGEIAELTRLAQPHVGIVTGASPAHLEFFTSVDAIADAKAELFDALDPDAVCVANHDDARIFARAKAGAVGHRGLVTYGYDGSATVQVLESWLTSKGLRTSVLVGESPQRPSKSGLKKARKVTFKLKALGAHNAHNAAGALAVVVALGLKPRTAAKALGKRFRSGKHRLRLESGANGLTILDDCYNANPTSVRAALDTLAAIAPKDAVLGAVIGTMRELGGGAAGLHQEIGQHAVKVGISWLAATGDHATDIATGAREAGLVEVTTAADADALTDAALAFAKPDHWLLLKGSRGERLERLLQTLTPAVAHAPSSDMGAIA
ncbi:MAG: UDP-N-acetylmuramoyl-tripeptide--D-alanyl-D-alanine ligase [Myxococcota bacterium]|jgi:UDP-N-acetylmuramoyl-tripeptide--D-alanyl-D-alanine ligase